MRMVLGQILRSRKLVRLALALALLALALSGGASRATATVASEATAARSARWSQLADTVFQHLGQEQGMPGPIATAIAQDADGFLWVGTQAGLARWDGYRFRSYAPDPALPGSLPDNYVLTLHVDTSGRLWIGTSAGGLARFDPRTDRFVVYPAGENGLSNAFVRSIADDGLAGIWVATDGGLDHLDPASGVISHQRNDPADPLSLPDNRVVALHRDRHGRLWIGTQKGLVRRDPDSDQLVAVPLPTADGRVPAVGGFCEDSEGRLWIGTRGAGAYVIAARSEAALPVITGTSNLANERVFAIVEARAGEIWIGTVNQGIVAIDPETTTTRAIAHEAAIPSSLSDNTIWAMHRDRSGLVWVGTSRGLDRHDAQQRAVLTVFGAKGRERGISDPDVISVLPLPNGQVWVGLGSNGVDVLSPDKAEVIGLRPDPARPDSSLPSDRVLSMDHSNSSVYLGTQRGLFRGDFSGQSMTRMRLPGRDPSLSVDVVHAVGDTLWLGSWVDGLWQLDARVPGSEQLIQHLPIERLVDRRINAIVSAGEQSLWLGTANGLDRLQLDTLAITHIAPDAALATALPAGSITSLLIDARQRLWVSTLGGGIAILDGAQGDAQPRFQRLTRAQGLPNDNVNKLLAFGDGEVWASTDDGLAVVDVESLTIRALRRAQGVAIPAYWGASGAATAAGEMLFGGGGGLTIVQPPLLQPWRYPAPVAITDLQVGGVKLPVGQFGDDRGPIIIQPAANSIAVEFAALDFSAPERNRYAFQLIGYDRDWIETDVDRRLAVYTNLPPGDYRLALRGSNREGVFGERELSVPVQVLPAWFQTWWFRALLAIAALLVVYAIVQARTAVLRHRGRVLEARVQERTAQLEQATAALREASLTDALTGLRNRRYLLQHIDADIAQCLRRRADGAADADLIFIMVDLDHFKQVNDQHGHPAGDAVLVQMAERLRQVFRASDHVVRWGGEEFLCVAIGTPRSGAAALAERLRCSIADTPFDLPDGQALAKTASIGYACFPFMTEHPDALGWQQVVAMADMALYTAKHSGRNAWVGVLPGARLDAGAASEQVSQDLDAAVRAQVLELYRSESIRSAS